MNILIITGLFPRSNNPGDGTFIANRINQLVLQNVNINLLILNHRDTKLVEIIKKIIKKAPNDKGVPLNNERTHSNLIDIRLGLWGRVLLLRLYSSLAKIIAKDHIKNKKVDLIHAHRVFPEGYIASKIHEYTGVPYIVTAHGSDIHTLPKERPGLKKVILETLENSKKNIFVSSHLKSIAEEFGYRGNNSTVIPNGVDTDLFKLYPMVEVENKLKIKKNDKKIVGFVGGLTTVKRADKLPDICYKIHSVLNTEFVIIGDGSLKYIIENSFKSYQLNFMFTGKISPDQVALWMNVFDILILPSRQEGFGCVVLEAQACGCPVVGSNAGGIPEAIGLGGLIVEDGDNFADRFAGAVTHLLKKPPNVEDLIRNASKYSWPVIIEKEIEIYKEAIKC